jgi:predicted Zn finger-like uncharacterized protein
MATRMTRLSIEADRARGNTAWIVCPACATWFPVNPRLLAPDAPTACCPNCHHEFRPEESPP